MIVVGFLIIAVK